MTAAEWFFLQDRKQVGPFTGDQIRSLFTAATIQETTLVWRPGCTDWAPLSNFAELNGQPTRPPIPPAAAEKAAMVANIAKASARTERSPADERGAPPALISANEWVDESPHPWRRYVARMLDNVVWGSLLLFIVVVSVSFLDPELGVEIDSWFEGRSGEIGATVLMHLIAVVPNALLIGLTGGNLGKWLCGVCVLDESDRPIGLGRAFRREASIFVTGLGLALPIISLLTLILSYQTLKREKATSWDKKMNLKLVHRRKGPAQYIGFIVAIILLVGLIISFFALDQALA
jgi:uncharacterized RDD family membrane protein YckC